MTDQRSASQQSTGNPSLAVPLSGPSKREPSPYARDMKENDKASAFSTFFETQCKAFDSAAVLYNLLSIDVDLVPCDFCGKKTKKNSHLTLIQGDASWRQDSARGPMVESVYCSDECLEDSSGWSPNSQGGTYFVSRSKDETYD